ncbi:hypothetical protein [Desulfoplanes sp.]
MFGFPPDAGQKAALEDKGTQQAMVTIAQNYAECPEIVNLSSRLPAVARKFERA